MTTRNRTFLTLAVAAMACFALTATSANAALIAHWSFDNSGDLGHDDIGADNGGTVRGVTYSASGKFGGAADFGTHAQARDITILSPGDFNTSTGWTMSLWFNSNGETFSAPDVPLLFHLSGTGSTGEDIQLRDVGGTQVAWNHARDADGTEAIAEGTSDVVDSQWHSLIAVFRTSNQTSEIYVDGVLEDTDQDLGMAASYSFTTGVIGNHTGLFPSTRAFGLMDEINVYNEPLTGTFAGDGVTLIGGDLYNLAVPVPPIPEPSTLALAAFGLLGLIGFGRRRKR